MRLPVLALGLSLGIVVWPAVAQDNQEGAAPRSPSKVQRPPETRGHITGTIFCNDTHRPARGAMVIVVPVQKESKTTGLNGGPLMARVAMDGTYRVDQVAPGEYAVAAFLPGYLSPFDDMLAAGMGQNPQELGNLLTQYGTVAVTPNGTGRFDLTLERGAAVSGRVVYSDGSPATQVTIEVENINAKPVSQQIPEESMVTGAVARAFLTHQSSNTNDLGSFRVSGLQPGSYRIAAVQQPSEQNNQALGVAMLIGFMPDPRSIHVYSRETMHKKEAKVYELKGGDDVSDIDITLPLNAFHSVSGLLTAKDGRPLNMGTLTLTDSGDDSLMFHAQVRRDGSFIFPTVPNGSYTLTANHARLGKLPDDLPANYPDEYAQLQVTNSFADGSIGVLVKDSDTTDVVLALVETTLTKAEPK